MPREPLGVRVQPAYKRLIERHARELTRSEGYIVEMVLWEMFRNELPPDAEPGRKMEDEKSE